MGSVKKITNIGIWTFIFMFIRSHATIFYFLIYLFSNISLEFIFYHFSENVRIAIPTGHCLATEYICVHMWCAHVHVHVLTFRNQEWDSLQKKMRSCHIFHTLEQISQMFVPWRSEKPHTEKTVKLGSEDFRFKMQRDETLTVFLFLPFHLIFCSICYLVF